MGTCVGGPNGPAPGVLLLFALLLPGLGAAAETPLEITGATQATLAWTPASGPVAGYYVIVSRNGGDPRVEGTSADTEEIVSGSYGDVLSVQVAAFDAEGVAGPASLASEPFTFVAASGGSDGGSGGGDSAPPADGTGSDGSGTGAGEPVPYAPFDLSGDGRSDLLVLHDGGAALWVMQGAAVRAVADLPRAPAGGRLVGSGDYDGNGAADLLWELPSGARRVWLLSGGAVVAQADLDGSGLETDADWRVAGTGDFDADGRDDVLLASRVLGVAEIWFMDGVQVAARARVPGRTGAWTLAAVLDADGDGASEVLWRDELAHVLELDDPAGPSTRQLADSLEGWRVVASGEMDGDGRSELLLHAHERGAFELWTVDAATVTEVRGVFLGAVASWDPSEPGDYDGDGTDDWVLSDPTTGAVAVGLSGAVDPSPQPVDRTLPAGAILVSGARVAYDAAFLERFCSGDVDGDGAATPADRRVLRECLSGTGGETCERADLDGDGAVTRTDWKVFQLRFSGASCP